MRVRRVAICAVMLMIVACGWGWGQDTYKDSLIEKCPFYETATGRLAPVYPALAQQIVQDFGITEGICVDVGGGCGSLAMALARITDLQVYMLDIDPWAVRLCNLLVDEGDLTGKVVAYEGDAQDMAFRDNFADLVVSRGSIFFWADQLAGLKECYRILKPGGVAYIGGGFSRILDPETRAPLVQWRMDVTGLHSPDSHRHNISDLVRKARKAGLRHIRVDREPNVGRWIVIRKPDRAGRPAPASQP